MRSQREDIIELLKASAEVSAIVGSGSELRIYNGMAPIGAGRPYLTIRLGSQKRPQTHDQRNNAHRRKADKCEWTLVAVGEDGAQAADLAEAIDNALDGQKTTSNAVLLFDDASDTTDYKQDGSGTILFSVSTTFVTRNMPE